MSLVSGPRPPSPTDGPVGCRGGRRGVGCECEDIFSHPRLPPSAAGPARSRCPRPRSERRSRPRRSKAATELPPKFRRRHRRRGLGSGRPQRAAARAVRSASVRVSYDRSSVASSAYPCGPTQPGRLRGASTRGFDPSNASCRNQSS